MLFLFVRATFGPLLSPSLRDPFDREALSARRTETSRPLFPSVFWRSFFFVPLISQGKNSHFHALNAGEDAVGVVPIGIVELGKIVRVSDVLVREAGMKAPREVDHLALLERLQ